MRYSNPILYSDFSDPDVIRVGKDFYMISSSFTYLPGIPVMHSRDLVHWELIGYAAEHLPFDRYNQPVHRCGTWAPSIRFHDGLFRVYVCLPDEGLLAFTAKDPAGMWECHHVLDVCGWIDPCPLFAEDGSVWLVHALAGSRCGLNNMLFVHRMSDDGLKVLDRGKLVYNGADHGDRTVEGGYGDKYSTCISVDCQNIEAVARLIDTMFTEEGTNCTTWGILDGDPILTSREDTAWTKGNGTYTVDENGVKHETEWANEMTENFYDGAFANKYRYAMSHVSFPRWGAGDYLASTREARFVASAKLWGEASNDLEYPAAIVLSVDEQKKAAPQLDDINNYIADMTRKFISGEEPLTNFDNYMDQLQKMGIEDLIAAYQGAYDRFLAR